MATVYLADEKKHGRKVAIKVLRPEITAALGTTRFLREIGIAAQLAHPHIVPLIDSGEAAGMLYYVQPHVPGGSLRERLLEHRGGPRGNGGSTAPTPPGGGGGAGGGGRPGGTGPPNGAGRRPGGRVWRAGGNPPPRSWPPTARGPPEPPPARGRSP